MHNVNEYASTDLHEISKLRTLEERHSISSLKFMFGSNINRSWVETVRIRDMRSNNLIKFKICKSTLYNCVIEVPL